MIKRRGSFGELQLNDIIFDIFGNNKKLYEIQHILPNKYKVDIIIFNQNGNIPIDSKFPLENSKRIVDSNTTENVKKEVIKLFKQDIKKHINDISSKYARQKNICITSPSTIIPLLSTLNFFNLNNKNKDITFLTLEKINNKFDESNNNLSKILKNIDTTSNNLRKLRVINNNIVNDFKNLLNLTENIKIEENLFEF